ncbi:MAG: metallophosphoesterase, partial [Deltaproteobacteria bacterium]|nr:metallophosphoesterase [Deltaproteobacteria bacterium]
AGLWPHAPQTPSRVRPLKQATDLIVLSDLHLAEGKFDDGTWSPREQFRVHKPFDNMVSYLLKRQARAGNRKLEVVLNGDIFDFLLVLHPAQGDHFKISDPSRDYSATETVALKKLRRIAEQHKPFFTSLQRLISAGHNVVFTIGNHDQELYFPAVKRELIKLITAGTPRHRGTVSIKPWFHLRGDVLIEHGHRYDPLNDIAYPLSPFRDDSGTRHLRPAAGTFLVTEWANKLRDAMPDGLKVSSARELWQTFRRLPPEFSRLAGLMASLSDRTGPLDPAAASKVVGAHRHAIQKIAGDPKLLAQLNGVRKANNQRPLNKNDLFLLLHKLDKIRAKPYLRTKEKRTFASKLRSVVRMLMPRNILPWINRRQGSTIREGERTVLETMANVTVTGHTHHPYLYKLSLGGKDKQLVNSGSWAHSGGVDKLTFVDIRQRRGKPTTVRLRRWDTAKHRPTADRAHARTYKPGRFPSTRALH